MIKLWIIMLVSIVFILFFMSMFLMSSSFLMMWVYMECSTLMFLVVVCLMNLKQKFSMISMYYLIQVLGSSMFMISLLMISFPSDPFLQLFMSMLYNFSLTIKLGLFPFHMWMINFIFELNWMGMFMLASFQKIMPMMMLSWWLLFNYMSLIVFLTMLVSMYNSLGLSSLKLIFGYSMLSHSAWMSLMLVDLNWWLFYFLSYSLLFFLICYLNFLIDIEDFSDYSSLFFSPFLIFSYLINLISLMGIPPFLGFIVKWILLDMLFMSFYYFMLFILMLTSVVHLYMYMRMILWGLINYSMKSLPMKYFMYEFKMLKMNLYYFLTFFVNIYLLLFMLMKF